MQRFGAISTIAFLSLILHTACGDDGFDVDSIPDAARNSPDAMANAQVAVPSTPDAMFAYLQARTYVDDGFTAESAVLDTSSIHSRLRTYVNDLLRDSLMAESSQHPMGAAAVKELHDENGVSGWAVSVKIADAPGPNSWYWYEVFSTTDGSAPLEGVGDTRCIGCHSEGSGAERDFIRIPYPLR